MVSKRIEAAIDLIGVVDTLIDVGTDHAHLAIRLIESKRAKHVIAVDNKRGPFEKAKFNVAAAGRLAFIDIRLSDGLETLDEPVDVAAILGMGGLAIRAILEHPNLKNVSALLLGPQSEMLALRRFLEEHGWRIEAERFVVDKKKHYPLIRAVRGTMKLTDFEAEYGPILLQNKDPLLFEHLARLLSAKEEALASALDFEKRIRLEQDIRTLRSHLHERH